MPKLTKLTRMHMRVSSPAPYAYEETCIICRDSVLPKWTMSSMTYDCDYKTWYLVTKLT